MATQRHGQIIETPTEARQAEPGPSVLALLTVSTGLAILILGVRLVRVLPDLSEAGRARQRTVGTSERLCGSTRRVRYRGRRVAAACGPLGLRSGMLGVWPAVRGVRSGRRSRMKKK